MNDQSEAPRIWANKGEAITCINGHAICECARNIHVGEAHWAEALTNWRQPQPSIDTAISDIRCTQCRGIWIRGNRSAGYQLHFGAPPHGEWR